MRVLILAAAAALVAGSAQAHAHLKASTPAEGSAGASPAHVVLTFTEGLVARFSGFELAGPGGPAAVKVSVAGTTMTGDLAKPLPAGAYEVRWHAVAEDTHRSAGTFSFTVK